VRQRDCRTSRRGRWRRIAPLAFPRFAAAEGDKEISNQQAIFAALLLCCFAIFVFEFTKRMHPEVTLEKLVALAIGVCYLVVAVVWNWVAGLPLSDIVWGMGSILLVVVGALALIWFDNVIGEMVGMKSGLVSKASPGLLIRLMGWIFLLGIIGMSLYPAFLGPA
jgi:hypothetical protein